MSTTVPNDEAIAYIWFQLVFLLVIGVLLWMFISYGMNLFMVQVNDRIDDGVVSEQTKGAVNYGMLALASVPIILLVGAFIYSILASVNKGRS